MQLRPLVPAVLLFALAPCAFPAQGSQEATPVVVELFTSEGCSSCPPADRLLEELSRERLSGVEIIPLGFHVDYFNNLGWRDRFSSPAYTARQVEHCRHLGIPSPYTPEIVVDGRWEVSGGSRAALWREVRRESQRPKAAQVEVTPEGTDRFHLRVAIPGGRRHKASVWLAVTEDELSTEVRAGENRSRTLHHAAVVRWLTSLGQVTDTFERVVRLEVDPAWRRDHLRAVFLVEDRQGEILGAARTTLPVQAQAESGADERAHLLAR